MQINNIMGTTFPDNLLNHWLSRLIFLVFYRHSVLFRIFTIPTTGEKIHFLFWKTIITWMQKSIILVRKPGFFSCKMITLVQSISLSMTQFHYLYPKAGTINLIILNCYLTALVWGSSEIKKTCFVFCNQTNAFNKTLCFPIHNCQCVHFLFSTGLLRSWTVFSSSLSAHCLSAMPGICENCFQFKQCC